MEIFEKYSEWYDLLYKDKNYKQESDYVEALINRYGTHNKKTLLDVGCGTGRHDKYFTDKGYKVVGIDKSPDMIGIATKAAAKRGKGIKFYICDSTHFNLNRKFDVAVALFHVMSYQVTNNSFLNTVKNIYDHLTEGGLFIFDFWYGPAVLTQKPRMRIKNISQNGISVKRTAEPRIDFNKNTADINFKVTIKNKKNGLKETIRETHKMRYFFLPELELMLGCAGFKKKICLEWMSYKNSPNDRTWSAVIVAQKQPRKIS